jgi:hypothetical protein
MKVKRFDLCGKRTSTEGSHMSLPHVLEETPTFDAESHAYNYIREGIDGSYQAAETVWNTSEGSWRGIWKNVNSR